MAGSTRAPRSTTRPAARTAVPDIARPVAVLPAPYRSERVRSDFERLELELDLVVGDDLARPVAARSSRSVTVAADRQDRRMVTRTDRSARTIPTRTHRPAVVRTNAFPCASANPRGATTRRPVERRANPAGPVSGPRRHRPSAAVIWRRRAVAVGLALCCLGVARQAGAALGGTSLAASDARPPVVVTYVVQPGDTLWSIAGIVAPDRDPRAVVDELRDARDSDVLYPGETIRFVAE